MYLNCHSRQQHHHHRTFQTKLHLRKLSWHQLAHMYPSHHKQTQTHNVLACRSAPQQQLDICSNNLIFMPHLFISLFATNTINGKTIKTLSWGLPNKKILNCRPLPTFVENFQQGFYSYIANLEIMIHLVYRDFIFQTI